MRSQDWQAKIEALCHELNITMESLAYHIPETKLETKRTPPKAILETIALRFDVNPKWLVGEAEEPVLLSTRCVRSSKDDIHDRFFSLQDDMTDTDFAKKIGLTVHQVRQIRKGNQELTEKLAESVAYYCDVSVGWLLCGDEESKDFPCDHQMIAYLETHKDVRKMVAKKMMRKEIVQTTPPTLNERLMEVMDDRQLTVEMIGNSTSTDVDLITSYLDGEVDIRWLRRFCKAYSISFKWLTSGEGRKQYIDDASPASAHLRAFRKGLGLTQKEFATSIGVSTGLIAQIETGRARLTEEVKVEIERVYPAFDLPNLPQSAF